MQQLVVGGVAAVQRVGDGHQRPLRAGPGALGPRPRLLLLLLLVPAEIGLQRERGWALGAAAPARERGHGERAPLAPAGSPLACRPLTRTGRPHTPRPIDPPDAPAPATALGPRPAPQLSART